MTFNSQQELKMLVLDASKDFFGPPDCSIAVRVLSPTKFELKPDDRRPVSIALSDKILTLNRGSLIIKLRMQ